MNLPQQLDYITDHPFLHGKFLQHLSALEKNGYQKLFYLKHLWKVEDKDFLSHLSDEARHAAHLKKMAQSLNEEKEVIGPPTKNYLTKLEVFILRALRRLKVENRKACYALLTYIIEKRAEKFYPCYEEFLSRKEGLSVRSIIDDEMMHLELMKQEISSMNVPTSIIDEALEYEENLFSHFMAQFKVFS